MIALSLEDLLFEVRRKGRLLPPSACSQVLTAAVRAAESQGVAPLPAMFLLDAKDGLVLDLQAAEGGHDPVRAAAELGRSLLLGPSGELQGPAEPVVRRALQQRGYETLGALRKALEEACPPLPPEARRKVFSGLHELVTAWQGGVDGGPLREQLESLASGRRPASPRPVPPVAPTPPLVAIVTPPAIKPVAVVEIAPARGARSLRTVGTVAISALAGALVATVAIRFTTKPPPQHLPEPVAAVSPPKLVVREPAPQPAPPQPATSDAPDAGAQAAAEVNVVQLPGELPAAPPVEAAPHEAVTPPSEPQAARSSTSRPRPARKSGGSSAQSEVRKGETALRQGQFDKAQVAFQAALSHDESFAPAIRGLAMVLMSQGREADAKLQYEKYLKVAPGAPDAVRIRKVVANLGGQ
jgi:tetratricopeptide (TPR) repeat protein